jgi:serine/threonine protein kinase
LPHLAEIRPDLRHHEMQPLFGCVLSENQQVVVGQTISHYRIVSQLGAGGMGVVYRAEDTRLGRSVALKFVSQDLAHDEQAVQRLRSEARAASALNHANICTIYDIGEADGHPFIVMELMKGETLRDRLNRGAVKVHQLLDVGIEVADALQSAHSDGIIHRDIKPGNIFLTERGHVKLLDFGLAKLTPHFTASNTTIATADPTVAGVTLGTISYMSPEQATGEELDGRTDLFSLGVVLYECATGHHPFAGKTPAVTLAAILNKPAVAPITIRPELPLRLQEVINNCLEKDRELRYQSAADLRADLRRLRRDIESGHSRAVDGLGSSMTPSAGSGASAPSAQVAPPASATIHTPAPVRRSPTWLLAIAAATGAIVLAAGVYFVSRPDPAADPAADSAVDVTASAVAPPDPAVQSRLALAQASVGARNFRAAAAYAAEVLAIDPGHSEAQTIRDESAAMLARFDQAVTDARQRLVRGDLAGAAVALDTGRGIDPMAPVLVELSSQLAEQVRLRGASAAARTQAPPPDARRQPTAAPDIAPAAPVAPVVPVTPAAPEPVVPVAPVAPVAPDVGARVAPVTPVAPDGRAPNPGALVAPVTPVAPDGGAPDLAAAGDEAAIRQLVADYARAIETKDLELFRALKPNLSREEERRLQEGFRAVASQRVNLTILSIDRSGDKASVVLARRDTIQAGGRQQTAESQQMIALSRADAGWRIVEIR